MGKLTHTRWFDGVASDGGRAAVKTAGRRGAISVKEAREILNLDTAAVSHCN